MMTPATEIELAEKVKAATGHLRIEGGGTRPIGRHIEADVLSTSALSGITLYEPGALTLVAQAGTPIAEIEAALDAENQRLAFEPMDHRTLLGTTGAPTIGGVVSGNVSGPRRIAVGACRDHALGVRFVDGSGIVTKNGGRVMKNVTGYDLVKLLTGAHGTLGVLSEVSLKVLPKPETVATLVLHDLSLAQSIAAMSAALGSPYEITGAATHGTQTCLRIEGFEASVTYRTGKLRDVLGACGDVEVIGADKSTVLWRDIADVSAFRDHTAVTKVSLKPSAAAAFAAAHTEAFGADIMLDWGGGLMWVGVSDQHIKEMASKSETSSAVEAIGQMHAAIQTAAASEQGHATLAKAPLTVRQSVSVFQPENPTITALSQGLRAKFDPRGILNAGLMG
jgi:glycolate oxidase FAD binding subunit